MSKWLFRACHQLVTLTAQISEGLRRNLARCLWHWFVMNTMLEECFVTA
jgi:hypothetical protein